MIKNHIHPHRTMKYPKNMSSSPQWRHKQFSHSNQHKTNTRGDKCWKWFVWHESCVIKIEGPRFSRVVIVIVSKNCKHADLEMLARNLLGRLFNYTPDLPQQSFPRAIMTAEQIRTVFNVSHRSDFRFLHFSIVFRAHQPIWQPIFRAIRWLSLAV